MPRLLRSGRRGREFGRPGRGAAVILLLPAHARGRHLPDRPRPGHLSSRSGGGPRSNRVWEAKAAPAASEPGPRCLLGAAAGVLRSTTLRSPPSRDGAAPPDRGRRRHPRGADTRGPAARPRARPALSRSSTDAWRRRRGQRGPAGPAPTPRQGPSETAAAGAAEGGGDGAGWCGERRGHGGGLGSRGAAVTRARGPRSARGWRRHFSAAKPRPAPPPPALHSRGGYRRFARACGGLAARCFPLRWGSPSSHLGGEPRVPRVRFYVNNSERGWGYLWSFRFAERVPIY